MTTSISSRDRTLGDILAIGFGTALAMWFVGYLGRLPGVQAPAPLLFGLFVLLHFLGGWTAGRFSQRGWQTGLWAGALTGAINVLILGSVLGGKSGLALSGEIARAAAIWAPACILIGAAIGAAGGLLATRAHPTPPRSQPWSFWFALVAMAATLILLPLGGAVTGFQAGLAVPDWPSSFGYNMFLFPLAKMTGGIYFEHSHRLFGSLVGLTTMALAAYIAFADRRTWVRVLAIVAFLMVVAQGLMGAARVTETNLALAAIHGVFGQLFFATLAILAASLSTTWQAACPPRPHVAAATDRPLSLACIAALLTQLVFGALLRHFNWGLHLHLTMAVIVLIVGGGLAMRSWSIYDGVPVVPRLGATILWILIVQLLLGGASLMAVWSDAAGQPPHPLRVLITTAHQTTGALLLACTVALAVWQRRLLIPASTPAASAPSAAPPALSPQTPPRT